MVATSHICLFLKLQYCSGDIEPDDYCGVNTMTLNEARAENILFFDFIPAMI